MYHYVDLSLIENQPHVQEFRGAMFLAVQRTHYLLEGKLIMACPELGSV